MRRTSNVNRVEIVLIVVVAAVALAGLAMVLSRAAGGRQPAQSPAAVEAGGDALAGLGPGVHVGHRGERLIVERTLHFANGDERWVEHRLADDRLGRSLWLEIQ